MGSFSPAALADPPEPPSGMFITAEKTDTEAQIRVRWKDFLAEDRYQLIRTDSDNPAQMLDASSPPALGQNWEFVSFVAKDTTEYLDNSVSIFGVSYGICALKDSADGQVTEASCFGPSDRVYPKVSLPAGVSQLQIFQRGFDRLGFQWIQTPDTNFSRASISQNGNVITSVENDPNQSIVFTGLAPNATFRLEVCVRNEGQSADSPTCRSITSGTLPRIPLAVSSVSVEQSDPNPHQRTINYTYDNVHDNAVIGLTVNIIKDNRVVKTFTEFPNTFGTKSYSHTFTGLAAFAGYEAWVLPYNQSGVGTSAGVGFTTPTEVNVSVIPLSADSVLVRWLAPAFGRYKVQRQSGGTWTKIGDDITVLKPSEVRLIVENMSGPQTLRVTWALAYLHSQSASVIATPLPPGTPELVSVHGTQTFIPPTPPRIDGRRVIPGGTARIGTRETVTFRTTSSGNAKYTLQRRTASGWQTVDSIGTLATLGVGFAKGSFHALRETTTGLFTGYRVCKTHLVSVRTGSVPLCSESSAFASEGVRRVH